MAFFRKEIHNYALYGFLFGCLFPIAATLIQCSATGQPFTWDGIRAAQRSSVLLWIIDTAPLFLGIFAAIGGHYLDKVKERNERLRSDIHEIEKLRDASEAANRAKSDFLANMSHEIRTPMNGIIGLTYLASRTDLSPQQQDYISKIDRSAQSLLRILNDLLDFSKIEAGKLEIETVVYSTQVMVESIVDIVNGRLSKKRDVEFIIERSHELPAELVGDELRIKQVLTNLLDNAVKFTEKGEVILSIDSEMRGEDRCALTFSVKDQGIGLTKAQLHDLFEPFVQADISHTRTYGGTGLGLAICDRLVRKMGGILQVESEPGAGSTFQFTIEQGLRVAHDPKALRLPFKERVRALLVDDSPMARTVQGGMLRDMGFDVIAVDSGDLALKAVRSSVTEGRPFSLIIMDWRMPGLNGLEAARILKEEFLSDTPMVLMVTAFGMEEVRSAAVEGRIEGYLTKPLDPSLLFDTLNAIFKFDLEGVRSATRERMDMDRVRAMLGGKELLLAEDNEINRQVATELLQDAGIRLDHAVNGEEAVRMFAAKRYDGVLMDIQMPLLDGLSAARQIRELPGGKDVPVMAMTAHAMKGEREKSLEAGMNDHIIKPIDPVKLYQCLLHWLCGTSEIDIRSAMTNGTDDQPVPADMQIPGLDVQAGLGRVLNNRETYRGLLHLFLKEWGTVPDELQAIVQAGDYEVLRRKVHTLAGSAGNLGADELLGSARNVEQLVANGPPADAAELVRSMAPMEIHLRTLLKELDQYLAAVKPEPSAPAVQPTGNATFRAAVTDVMLLLSDHDSSSVPLLGNLAGSTNDEETKRILERAHQQAMDWEFAQAINTMKELQV
ncbi:MAG: response regulator [Flavobacteriales bacterium]|nr:response regulator [Flavobacteriales bacterium]